VTVGAGVAVGSGVAETATDSMGDDEAVSSALADGDDPPLHPATIRAMATIEAAVRVA
jgi:hypothetical protein